MILECLNDDGVIIFPTDTIYGIGCSVKSNKAFERIAQIKGIKKEKAVFGVKGTSVLEKPFLHLCIIQMAKLLA